MMKAERTFRELGVCVLAVAAVATILPTVVSAQSETFDSEAAATAAGWAGFLNGSPDDGEFGPYGFSATNFTGGNPEGEAGGIFQRTPVRNYYADLSLTGTPSADAGFSASGELFVLQETADNDTLVGHFLSSATDELNHAGFILRESSAGNFRFMARIRGDGGNQHDGDQIVVANGAYRFDYAFDPTARTLTANLYEAGGGVLGDYNDNGTVDAADYATWRNGDSPDDSEAGYNLWKSQFGSSAGSPILVATSTTAPLNEGELFTADAFGLSGGFNSAGNFQMTVFIDDVTYTSVVAAGVASALVPEPASILLLALAALAMCLPRRLP